MSFKMDFDQRTPFPNIVPGMHNAVIHSALPEKGPQGNYLKLRFSLDDSELNQQAWLNLSLTKGAEWKVARTVRALGLTEGEVEYKNRTEYEAALSDMLTGVECVIEIEHEDYKGTTYDRVVDIQARE